MYAVIRAGGRQFRVAPGDVIRVEKQAHSDNGTIEFSDVLAVSAQDGQTARPQGDGARVTGRVLEDGRADQILVFHYKRKKQYKKLAGHRQPFTAVRITEISFDGQSFKAPHQEEAAPRPKKARAGAETPAEHEVHARHATAAKKAAPKAKAK